MQRIHSLLCPLAFFSCLVLAGCSSSGSGSGPGRTVERFLRALESGDVTTASEMMGGVGPKSKSVSKNKRATSALRIQAARISRAKGLQSIEILSEKIDGTGTKATVRTQLIFRNGQTSTGNFPLVRVDGRWVLSVDP